MGVRGEFLEIRNKQVHSVPGSGAGVGECEGPAGMSTACVRNRKVSEWGPWLDGGGERPRMLPSTSTGKADGS